jgi:cell division protease FtsH
MRAAPRAAMSDATSTSGVISVRRAGRTTRRLVPGHRSIARVVVVARAEGSDGADGASANAAASAPKTESGGDGERLGGGRASASAGSSAGAPRRRARASAPKPAVKATPVEVVDTYESAIGKWERKIKGEPWFRKGNATAQDARPDGLRSSSKPLLTPGTKEWYDAWRVEQKKQKRAETARELRKMGRKPTEAYKKAGQAAGKPLSIEELKFTPLGRAKMQLERQHIAYNRFVTDIMREEIKELYVSVDAVARYAAVYNDGRLAYCQVAPNNTEVYDITQIVGLEIKPTMAEPASHTLAAVGDRDSAVKTFIAGYGLPSLGVFIVWAIVFYMQRFRGDWEDRQKILELERAEEAQRQAEKGDPRIRVLEEMLEKIDEKDPQRDTIKREIRNRKAAIARANGDKKDAAAKAADGDQMGAANAFMKVGVKVVKKKKKVEEDLDFEDVDDEEEQAADKTGKKGAKKGRVNTKMKLRDESEVVTFDDVAGIGTAKVELQEVVDFFLKPDKFKASGSKVPKGVLLTGPPGCGKTLLARAVAGEAGATFFSLAASEFVEMFVGVGAARVRDLFQQAKKQSPSIIFIDELDAVGRPRGGGGSGNDERDQTLNQLLVELDGFGTDTQIVCIAATNRVDVLDKALVRPGRFDRKIVIPKPDYIGRKEILQVHAKNKPIADNIDWNILAGETEGFSGAALASVVNLAALQAAKKSREKVTMDDFQTALETETLGKVLPQGLGEENEKRLALVHAAAAVGYHLLCKDMVELSFATIVARESNAEGQVAIAENPVALRPGAFTKGFLRRHLRTCLVPSVAEEVVYGFDNCTKVTAPYSGRAREIAAFFVNNCAMSDEDSEFSYIPTGQVIEVNDFLRSDRVEHMLPSTTADRYIRADEETRRLMENQYAAARRFVLKQRAAIEAVQAIIIEKRTVQADELTAIIDKLAVAPFDDEERQSVQASDRTPFREWNGTKPADKV